MKGTLALETTCRVSQMTRHVLCKSDSMKREVSRPTRPCNITTVCLTMICSGTDKGCMQTTNRFCHTQSKLQLRHQLINSGVWQFMSINRASNVQCARRSKDKTRRKETGLPMQPWC